MKRSRKSNRVFWAPGVNLVQVRMFSVDDCPSKIGVQAQDHLQEKSPRILQHSNHEESDAIPPGFESYLRPLTVELSCISKIEWKCPPKFFLSSNWHVAAGEASEESKAQKLRGMGVLESFYPRLLDIPSSPIVSLDIQDEHYDDSLTPVIPLTPIEEKEAADIPVYLSAPVEIPIIARLPALPQCLGTLNSSNTSLIEPSSIGKQTLPKLLDPGADAVRAASAAVTAIINSKEQGSLIDTDLLVKILSDPKMIEELSNDHGAPGNAASSPILSSKPETRSTASSYPKPTMVFASLPAKGSSHDMPKEVQYISKPVRGLVTPSCPKPETLLAPVLATGSLHHLPGNVQPAVTRMSAQLGTLPLSGLQVAPSSSSSTLESIVCPPGPAVGQLYFETNQVQPTVTSVPIQSNRAPKSLLAPTPKLVTNMVPSMVGMVPAKQNTGSQTSAIAMRTNPVKDVNYIKNLIREHGEQKAQMLDRNTFDNGTHCNHFKNMEFMQNEKLREVNPKFKKACMYFKSSRGCRNGANCPYQHDFAFKLQTGIALEIRSAKRVKLDREISGRT